MSTSIESTVITTPNGILSGIVHFPDSFPASVIVCCHGLLSSKESIKYSVIGEEFSRAGLAVLRFDFSGCGESPPSLERRLLPARLQDLRSVLDHVQRQPWSNGCIGLLGSSLGGYLSLMVAAEDEGLVRGVVCWATPFDLKRIDIAFKDVEAFRDLFPEGSELGDPKSLESLPPVKRILVIHGQQDETIPWCDALEIYRRVDEPKRLCLLKTGDHRLLDPECRELARRLSLEWFREQCF